MNESSLLNLEENILNISRFMTDEQQEESFLLAKEMAPLYHGKNNLVAFRSQLMILHAIYKDIFEGSGDENG